jgi:hypothetical protein
MKHLAPLYKHTKHTGDASYLLNGDYRPIIVSFDHTSNIEGRSHLPKVQPDLHMLWLDVSIIGKRDTQPDAFGAQRTGISPAPLRSMCSLL